jgi:CHAT domain-containing protein/ATP/maltotriose-dependent transcriptional regulator MalT
MATPWSAPGAVSAIRARRDTEAGFAAYQRGDLDEATERFTRALNRRAKQPPSAETAELLNALARIHHDRGDYPQAAQASQQAWDIGRRVATTRGQQETADALNNLARVDLAQGRYAAALAKFRQAHDLLTDDGRPTLASAVITQNVGAAYDYLGDLPAALTHYQQALDTMVALGGSPARRVGCMNNIATIHYENGEFDAALRLLNEALELCRDAGLVAVGATVLLNMGQILVDRGEQQQGVDRIEAALRIRQAMAARSVAVASAQESLARAYLAAGLSDEAAAQARAAVEIQAEQASGSAGHATSLATLGAVQRAAGDFDAALRLQRQALTIHEAIQPDSLGAATDLNNIGLIYHDLGDLRRAARYYTRALPLYEARSPRSATTATMHNNLGVVLHALGDLDGALHNLEIALALDRQAAARSPAVATDLMNIASVLLTRGEHQRALAYLNEAVDLDSAAIPDSPARAASLAALATTLAQDGQLDAALALARQAIDIDRRSAPRSDRMLSDLTLLGDLLVRHGAPAAAIEVLTEAVDLVDSIWLRSGTDERRREFALADRHATYRHLIAALLRRGHEGDAEAAFLYSERARARSLNDRLAREAATGEQPGDILRLLAEEEQLRRRLSILRRAPAVPQALSPPEEAARDNGERERLEARLDDVVELRLARAAPAGGPGGTESMPRLAELQASLAAYEIALCYHIGTDAVIAWAVTAERLRTYTLPVGVDRLAELVDEVTLPYREGDPGAGGQPAVIGQLAAVLLAPWYQEQASPAASQLIVVPDGRLAYLPFEMLPLPDERLLADHLTVSYAPSLSTLIWLHARPASTAPSAFVAFADPVISQSPAVATARPAGEGAVGHRPQAQHDAPGPGRQERLGHPDGALAGPAEATARADNPAALLLPAGHQLSPLPGTRAEAQAIARLFGADGVAFVGPDNTARRVRDAAPRYRIQHWATHSLLDEVDPDFSGLVVSPSAGQAPDSEAADDLVTVYDLARLSLQADLVVCSACQTGLGTVRAGEGTIGMSKALLSAGARCVVLSLWPVPDRPTRRLMLAFYQALRRGEPPADALRTAKAEVRRRYPRIYQYPFTWAAFVVIGDGTTRAQLTSPIPPTGSAR